MKYIKFFILAGLMIALFGCEFTTPKSVRIKSDPTITIPLGTRENVVSSEWNYSEELTTLTSEYEADGVTPNPDYIEGLSYTPGTNGTPVELQLQMDILDISVNDFAGETLALDGVNQTISPISFSVPELNFPGESISENIAPVAVPGSMTIPTLSITNIPELSGSTVTQSTPDIVATGYSSATFSAGILSAAVNAVNGSAGLDVQINSARIMDGATEVVVANNTPVAVSGNVDFDMTGVTMPSTFQVEFDIQVISGAGAAENFDLSLDFGFSSDAAISEASGIDVNETISDTVAIPLNTGADFNGAVIGTGSVGVSIALPAAWTNMGTLISLALYEDTNGNGLADDGSSVADSGAATADSATLDLAGVAIGSGDLLLEYTVVASGTNADFILDPAADEVTGNTTASVTSFSSLELISADLDFSETINQPIDQEIRDLVNVVTFTSPSISISLNNQLPADIIVTVDSAAMRVNDNNTFLSGTNNTWDVALLPAAGGYNANEFVVTDYPEVVFNVSVAPSGYDPNTDILTLTNVTPGSTYSLDGSVSASLDISSVQINQVNFSDQFPAAGEGGIDMSELDNVLPDTVSITGLTTNLNYNIDSGAGSIFLSLWTDDYDGDTLDDYLVGSNAYIGGGDTSGMQELTGGTLSINGVADIINARPSYLVFYYDLYASGATINIVDPSVEQRITASLDVTIPLSIDVAAVDDPLDPYDQYGAELTKENPDDPLLDPVPIIDPPTEDIFGRDTATTEEIEDINEMIGFAEEVTISGTITNTMGFAVTFVIDDPGSSFYKEITLADGPIEIQLTAAEIEIMRTSVSFRPEIHIFIPPGTHTLNEGGDIAMHLNMQIQTNVDYVVDLEEGQ